MIQAICILGRQPALGLAELESLYGTNVITPLGGHAAGLTLSAEDVDFKRLGGSTRLAVVLGEVDSTVWTRVEKALGGFVKSTAFALPAEGKFHLGLSVYGFNASPSKINALGLTLKKILRSRHDGSVRLAPNNDTELGAAQVIHNRLVTPQGTELLLVAGGDKTYIAKTIHIQDIASYTTRDRERPRRDARVGMLPPKLAQIILNLAAGKLQSQASSVKRQDECVVLDPFCGTGVLLQEALLMGYAAYGTDLDPRMIEYSQQNLAWLKERFSGLESRGLRIEHGDATTHQWQPTPHIIACETYLGRPFTERPSPAILAQTISEVNLILKRFLQNITPQLQSDTRLCLALPCWFDEREQKHLPLLDHLADMGLERLAFQHAAAQDLVYHREGQIVGRELVTLVRK